MSLLLSTFTGTLTFLDLPNLYFLNKHYAKSIDSFLIFKLFTQLTWLTKPVFALLIDNFAPFKKKITPYVVLLSLVIIFLSILIIMFEQSFSNFLIIVSVINFCVGMIDTLGEGLAVVVTQNELRKDYLERELHLGKKYHNLLIRSPDRTQQSIEIENIIKRIDFAKFFLLREFIRDFCRFFGGVLYFELYFSSSKKDDQVDKIKFSYLIYLASPVLLLLYTIFFFKEVEVNFL